MTIRHFLHPGISILQFSKIRKCVYAKTYKRISSLWGDIMAVKDAVTHRFQQLCRERNIKINELATLAGITPSTVYSMMDERRRDISIITIKKLCDGLDMTLGEFFSTPEFDQLEQEIK